MSYPRMLRIRQRFARPRVTDIAAEVAAQLAGLRLDRQIQAGQTVAITAGSRGIANIRVIIRAVAEYVRGLGGQPFIVPAMGSHGGGTADGQRQIIESYGITAEYCGCPIRASMETVVVCQAAEGFDVHFDQQAFGADHVIVCGRVKPHTGFQGDIQSGLMKMLLIGLGKHAGAKIYHRAIQDYDFGRIIRSVASEVLERCPITAGLAIVENAYDETALIAAVPPAEFEEREIQLLRQATEWMPRLPFQETDVLLVDQIGKNISGTGMDTNIVGRKFGVHHWGRDAEGREDWQHAKNIVVRGLTAATHGNATGIGLAEFCRSRAIREMNDEVTRVNALTGQHVAAAMKPLDYETDREILDRVLKIVGLVEPPQARLQWIANTLEVSELVCSEAYRAEALERDDLELLDDTPCDLPLDNQGNLPDCVRELFDPR